MHTRVAQLFAFRKLSVHGWSALPSYTLLYDSMIYMVDLRTFFAVVLVIGHAVYQFTALATKVPIRLLPRLYPQR